MTVIPLLALALVPAAAAATLPPVDQQVGPVCVPVVGGLLGGDTCAGFWVHNGADGLHAWFILPCGVGNVIANCGLTVDQLGDVLQVVVTPQLGCRMVCVPSSSTTDVTVPAQPGDATGVAQTTCVLSLCGVESVSVSAAGIQVALAPLPCVNNLCPPAAQGFVGADGSALVSARALCGSAGGGACLLVAGSRNATGEVFLNEIVVGQGPVVTLQEKVSPQGSVYVAPNPSCVFTLVAGIVECQQISAQTGNLLQGDVSGCAFVHLYGVGNLQESPCFP